MGSRRSASLVASLGTTAGLAWLVFTPNASLAALKTWDGGGGADGTFTLDANWDTTAPASSLTTDQAMFPGEFSGFGAQPTLTANRSINKITFGDATAGGWNIGGNSVLTLGGGGISSGTTTANAGSNTISANFAVGANQTWSVFGNSGALTIDGVISGSASYRLTLGSGGANGPTGTLIFTANNTYAGVTQLGSGILRVIDTTTNIGNTTVAKNGLGTGGVLIGNSDASANGNTPILQIRVNGENNDSAQTLTYGNNLSVGVIAANGATIDLDRASGTGTNKIVAFGSLNFGRANGYLNVTGSNGYKLSVGALTVSPTTTDGSGFTLNPTTADIIVASATNAGSAARTPQLVLSGTSTGSAITGAITDRTSGAATVTRVTKSSAGTWQFQGANSYTGLTDIQAGTLKLDANATLGVGGTTLSNRNAGTTTVAAAGTLDLSGVSSLAEPITLSGTLTNSSAAAATIGSGLAVIKPNAGSKYTVVPTVSISGGGGTGATATATMGLEVSNITITNGGTGYTTASGGPPTVTVSGGTGYGASFSPVITGGAVTALTLISPGVGYTPGDTLTISFTGGAGSGATGTINSAELSVSGVQVTNVGSGYTSAPTVSFVGTGSVAGVATATASGVALSGTTSVINGTGNISILGSVTGSGSFTKSGNNTLILSGADTYTGKTTITGGALLVNGTRIETSNVTVNGYGSATNGHYLVSNGGTLGGNGRIAGFNGTTASNMVYVEAGGTVAPGGSIGTLVLDGQNITGASSRLLNMATDAAFVFELAGDGSTPDRIDLWSYGPGDLVLNSNKVNLSLDGSLVPGTYTVDLFRFFSNAGSTATASGISTGLTLDGATVGSGIANAQIIYNANAISLQYTVVVPEPSTVATVLGGFGMLLGFRRPRRQVGRNR